MQGGGGLGGGEPAEPQWVVGVGGGELQGGVGVGGGELLLRSRGRLSGLQRGVAGGVL